MRDNLCMAKRFSDTVRYIDDLLTLNNNSFEEEIINIYPPELTLKKTTESNSTISYLDISISICNNKYVTEVYDKWENFNFKIVNYPYMCSNIRAKPTYGVYVSQLISRGGSRIDCRGGLSIPRALARAKIYVLRPLLTSFPHTTCYTKKK